MPITSNLKTDMIKVSVFTSKPNNVYLIATNSILVLVTSGVDKGIYEIVSVNNINELNKLTEKGLFHNNGEALDTENVLFEDSSTGKQYAYDAALDEYSESSGGNIATSKNLLLSDSRTVDEAVTQIEANLGENQPGFYIVGEGAQYEKINDAVTAYKASGHSTGIIKVLKGHYSDPVVIDAANVTIESADAGNTTHRSHTYIDAPITITEGRVTIHGLNVRNITVNLSGATYKGGVIINNVAVSGWAGYSGWDIVDAGSWIKFADIDLNQKTINITQQTICNIEFINVVNGFLSQNNPLAMILKANSPRLVEINNSTIYQAAEKPTITFFLGMPVIPGYVYAYNGKLYECQSVLQQTSITPDKDFFTFTPLSDSAPVGTIISTAFSITGKQADFYIPMNRTSHFDKTQDSAFYSVLESHSLISNNPADKTKFIDANLFLKSKATIVKELDESLIYLANKKKDIIAEIDPLNELLESKSKDHVNAIDKGQEDTKKLFDEIRSLTGQAQEKQKSLSLIEKEEETAQNAKLETESFIAMNPKANEVYTPDMTGLHFEGGNTPMIYLPDEVGPHTHRLDYFGASYGNPVATGVNPLLTTQANLIRGYTTELNDGTTTRPKSVTVFYYMKYRQ